MLFFNPLPGWTSPAIAGQKLPPRITTMTVLERYVNGIDELVRRSPNCRLDIGWGEMLCVLAACQLALRHPNMPANAAANVWQFVETAIAEIDAVVPDLAAVLRMGSDPRYDR